MKQRKWLGIHDRALSLIISKRNRLYYSPWSFPKSEWRSDVSTEFGFPSVQEGNIILFDCLWSKPLPCWDIRFMSFLCLIFVDISAISPGPVSISCRITQSICRIHPPPYPRGCLTNRLRIKIPILLLHQKSVSNKIWKFHFTSLRYFEHAYLSYFDEQKLIFLGKIIIYNMRFNSPKEILLIFLHLLVYWLKCAEF